MNEISLLAIPSIILAMAFILAGIKTFADRPAHLRTLGEFGIPAALRTGLAAILTAFELGIGAALLLPEARQLAATAAFCLLLCYTAAIAANLLGGRRPSCNCFGQFSGKPISHLTLLRNGGFLALCALLVWPDLIPAQWSEGIAVAPAMLGALAIGLTLSWLVFHLLLQNGRLMLRLDTIEQQLRTAGLAETSKGLPIGQMAPDFKVVTAKGRRGTFSQLRSLQQPTIIVFSDAACTPCRELMPRLAQWYTQYGTVLTILVVTTAPASGDLEVLADVAEVGFVQEGREAAQLYGAASTPSAVMVSREGTIGSSLAVGATQIEQLVHAIAAAEGAVTALPMPPRMQPV